MPREAWFLSYGLLGLTQNGLAPILLPLSARSAATAGVTYAAFALAGLAAPALGTWADNTGRHRELLVWGCAGSAIFFLLFSVVGHGPLRILLAAGAGLGVMAATTAGNVLAIQGWPEDDWDERVARLQAWVSGGQVIGLIAAGLMATAHPLLGFLCAGAVLLIAALLAQYAAPRTGQRAARDKPIPQPLVGGEAGVPGPQHHAHRVGWADLRNYLSVVNPPLWRFLMIWLIGYVTMNGIATLFPVVMTRQYGMAPYMPATAYAIGVGLSLLLYEPVSVVTHRRGAGFMLRAGFGTRLVLYAVLTALGMLYAPWAGWLVLVAFALTQVAWPLLSVAANTLSVRLAPAARGEAVGLFNAATAVASSAGSALGGAIFGLWGFAALAGVTALAVSAGLVLAVVLLPVAVQKSRSA